jgi:hypothetical protein
MTMQTLVRQAVKHRLSAYPTVAEAHRFEELARDYYGVAPAALLRRLMLEELARTRDLPLAYPCPDTV